MSPKATIVLLALPLSAAVGCKASADKSAQPLSAAPTSAARLVALLPMNEGYGATDHDAYEQDIAPIAAEHGMTRDRAYTISKYLGGAGPAEASTLGVWSLDAPGAVQAVMGDARYQAHVEHRDRIHDMANAVMYLATEEPGGEPPEPGHALLVGVLAMRPEFGFEDHVEYEQKIEPIARRHGMRLVRSFRVDKQMSEAGPTGAVAINLWDLTTPEVLGKVMSDPEYQANIEYRDRIHDMSETTMYFVAPR